MPREQPELVSEITNIEIIAVGSVIRGLPQLREIYGGSRWHKLNRRAYVIDEYGEVVFAEVHCYECHGIGRRQL